MYGIILIEGWTRANRGHEQLDRERRQRGSPKPVGVKDKQAGSNPRSESQDRADGPTKKNRRQKKEPAIVLTPVHAARSTKGVTERIPHMTRTHITITTQFNVTLQQIDRCDKVVDYGRRKCFYQVESQSQPDMTYHVEWNGKLTCTCKGAQAGYTSWHRRAALAPQKFRRTGPRDPQPAKAAY